MQHSKGNHEPWTGQAKGFRWCAGELVAQEAISAASRKGSKPLRSFPLRMVDSVFLKLPVQEGKPIEVERWVYTNKAGLVVEKKREDCTWEKIQDRMCRFSLANPENRRRTVAVLRMRDGSEHQLDEPGLQHLTMMAKGSRTSKEVLASAVCLQSYVRPHQGVDQVCRATYVVDSLEGRSSLEVRMLARREDGMLLVGKGRAREVEDRLQGVVEACAWEVVRCLEAAGGVLTSVAVDFIVDDNRDPWLAHIHDVSFFVKPPPTDSRPPPAPAFAAAAAAEEEEQEEPSSPPFTAPQTGHQQQLHSASSSPQKQTQVRQGSVASPAAGASKAAVPVPETEEGGEVALPRVPPALNKPPVSQQQKKIDRVLAAYSDKPRTSSSSSASSAAKPAPSGEEAAAAVAEAVMEAAIRAQAQASREQPAAEGIPRPLPSPDKAGKGGSKKRAGKAEEEDPEAVLRRAGPREAQLIKDFQAPAPGDADLAGIIKESRRFNEVVIGLREKNETLEEELRSVREQVKRSEEARLQAETEARDAHRRMLSAKQAFTRALQEKDEEVKRTVLELEGKHSKELAAKAADIAALRSQEAKGEVPDAQKGVSSSAVANKGLVQKLEELEVAFSTAKVEWAREKRQIMSAHAQEIQELNMLSREQGSSNIGYMAKLEDEIEDLKTQIDDAKKLVAVVEAREREANARRLVAEAEQDRLAAEKRQLQEHLKDAQGFEVKQDNGVAVDGEKALATLAATSEAKVRQANNKVEYLKAQLSSEQTLKAELEATVAGMKEKLLKQKQESKKQLAAAEEAKKAAVRDTEERLRQDMEGYISEVAHLQGKVMTLQGQLGDALQDVGLAKRREEGQKSETSKAHLEVSALQLEVDSLKKQIDENARAAALDEDYRAKLATSEAMLRRLDNERLYLKSQLATEITCKNELQATMDQAHREYGEARSAWKKEREEMDEAARQANIKRESMEAELKRYRVQAEAELAALSQQNADLKTSYAKTRDQLRIEQAAIERVQAANRRLQDELLAQHEELKNARAESDGAARRQIESLEVVKASMEQIEAEKAGEIARLQTELHTHLKRMGQLQDELASQKQYEATALRKARRAVAAQRIFLGMEKWSSARRLWALYSWRQGVAVVALGESAGKRLRQAVDETAARSRSDMEVALAAQAKQLRSERQQALQRVTELAEEQMEAMKREADTDQGRAVAELEQRLQEALANQQMGSEERLTRLGFGYQETLAKLKFEYEEKMLQTQLSHEAALAELKRQTEERVVQVTREANEKAEQTWQKYVKDKLAEVKQERACDLDAARDHYRRALDRREEAFAKEKEDLAKQAAADRQAALEQERKQLDERMAAAMAEVEEAMRQKMAEVERQHATRIKKVEAHGAEKLREAEEAGKRAEKTHVKATVDLRKTMEEQRSKAVRLEIAKWQRALSEAEQQMEAEKAAAWKRGVDERDAQAKHEAAQLQIAGEVALSELRESARRSLDMAQRRANEILEATKEQLLKEKEDALRALKERVERELREQWDDAMRDAMDKADKAKEAAVEEERRQGRMALSKLEVRLNEERVVLEVKMQKLEDLLAAAKAETAKVRDAMTLALAEADQAFDKARESWAEAQREALWKQAQELLKEKEAALAEAGKQARQELDKAVEDLRAKAASELQHAVAKLEAERAAVVEKMEAVIAGVRHEVAELQREVARKKELLDEAVGRHDELMGQVAAGQQRSSFDKMRLLSVFNKTRERHVREMESERRSWEEQVKRAAEAHLAECQQLEGEIRNLQDIVHECEARRLEMYETLVNHKREVLMEHKVQSEVLAREAEQLAQQRESVEGRKKELQRDLKRAEEGVKELEHELHEHGKKSSIKHGRIDVAHARKKKRLDEELEAAIETIEAKRHEVLAVDDRLAELLDLRQDKEDEMKVLERKLVEVLVEQQKKLLHILNEEGVMITDRLDKAGPHAKQPPPAQHARMGPSATTNSALSMTKSPTTMSGGARSLGFSSPGGTVTSQQWARSPASANTRASGMDASSSGSTTKGRGSMRGGGGPVGRKGGRLSDD